MYFLLAIVIVATCVAVYFKTRKPPADGPSSEAGQGGPVNPSEFRD